MRLVRLSLGALGPFPGEHTIDVDELGASGLFLLEGPTGSGKSTLIDAVVFALYGKVASADATEERLRSAHAAPDAETYVELTFATGSGLYRVRRTPAYARPKQRGTGTTTQPASVRLWRLTSPDAPGEVLATRIDEAGLEIARVVGLDRQQFVQTVVLPQGEFAAFLRADPEQRRGVLQRVFGTEVYEQVAQRLERMRAEAARAVADAEAAVGRAAARFLGAAGIDAEPAAAPGSPAAAIGHPQTEAGTRLAAAEEVATVLAEDAADATQRAAVAVDAAARARAALDAQRALATALATRDRLRAEAAVLAAAEPEVAVARQRLAGSTAAEQLWPWVDRAGAADALVTAAAEDLEIARASASADLRAVVGVGDPEVELKALAAEIELGVTARGGLARALGLETGLEARREEHAVRRSALGVLRGRLAALDAALAPLPGRRAARAADLAEAREQAHGLVAARVALTEAAARSAAARQVTMLAADLTVAEAVVAERAATATAATRELAAAHEARIAGIAGELATALVPGRACPVCGSTEHPAPAEPAPTAPDPAAAEDRRAAAEAALHTAAAAAEVLRDRLAAACTAAGDQEQAAAEEADAQAAVRVAEAAVAREAALLADIAALDAEHDAARAARAESGRELAVEEVRLAQSEAALAADEVEVLAAADGAPSVRSRDEAWRHRVEEAKRWADALRAWSAAAERAAVADRERDTALVAAGRTLGQVVADRLPADQAAALAAAVAEHEAATARVHGALADPALADLPDAAPGALGEAEAAAAATSEAAAQAEGEAAVLRERTAAAGQALVALSAAVTGAAAARAEAAPVTRMANLATASGGEGALTLATYVLGQRFADLVAAANARLSTVSDGRYELVRSTEREAVRSRRLGLAMQVLDHVTGQARDPRTLSGGETFYVSLCLALGLADVVTAEAGGVELGTLLIDEGFGSLDAQTLDMVLAELGRLRDGGRVVGVVSHVDTLKSAIAERVEVRRRPGGGSTLRVVA